MTLQLIGAGLPRTGTMSLRAALERLLGAPCHHMTEFFARPEQAPAWADAFAGRSPDWPVFLSGYAATVDTPACAFWRELAEAFPDAKVLLSRRTDAATWYRSMEPTVLTQIRRARSTGAGGPPPGPAGRPSTRAQQLAVGEVLSSVAAFLRADEDQARIEARYDEWLAEVRAEVPAGRLIEWQPGDGWEPLCAALGTDIPDEPFPHVNSTAEFRSRTAATG